jgi:4-amino-4-deoxy-L-arabinose transferase-like glycosyltransferase
MQIKPTNILLILILIFSFILRICSLETIPAGTHPDEASWGYNAYSILETGKDEHGISYPLIFKAFGDQKLPVYTYAVVLSVKLFGLTNFAVRFPSVILGSLFPLLIYLLLKQCKLKERSSLLGAFIVTISPWTIILSRIFTPDSNVALFFFTAGIYLALKSLENKKSKSIFLSGFFFALTWYSYIAYRLITPVTIFILVLIFFRKKFLPTRPGLLLLTIFLTFIIPLLIIGFKGTGSARFSQVLSTPLTGMILEINENRTFCNAQLPTLICSLHDNKIVSYITVVMGRYVKTFSPQYLFLEGEKDHFLNIEHYGLLYLPLLIPYLSGIIYFGYKILNKKLTKIECFILSGLILAPSAALIVNEPVKTRLSALIPFLILFVSTGYEYFLTTIRSEQFKRYFHFSFILVLSVITIFFMIDLLFIHIPKNDFTYKRYSGITTTDGN